MHVDSIQNRGRHYHICIEEGPRGVNVSYVQIQKFVYILFSFIVLDKSVSHLNEMSMLIS